MRGEAYDGQKHGKCEVQAMAKTHEAINYGLWTQSMAGAKL